jgi:hypothetical protein
MNSIMFHIDHIIMNRNKMCECELEWILGVFYPFIFDTRSDGIFDSHDVSDETFFGYRLRIDMSMPWGFVGQL